MTVTTTFEQKIRWHQLTTLWNLGFRSDFTCDKMHFFVFFHIGPIPVGFLTPNRHGHRNFDTKWKLYIVFGSPVYKFCGSRPVLLIYRVTGFHKRCVAPRGRIGLGVWTESQKSLWHILGFLLILYLLFPEFINKPNLFLWDLNQETTMGSVMDGDRASG